MVPKFLSFLFLIIMASSLELYSENKYYFPSIGAGYLKPSDPRPAYQIEARSHLFLRYFRMQLGFLTENFKSGYTYGGIGFEKALFGGLYFYPNFSPGIYFRGNGVRLGCPVEFRSALELFYHLNCKLRLGWEFFHLSNAHLGHHNPGVNGVIFYLAFGLD